MSIKDYNIPTFVEEPIKQASLKNILDSSECPVHFQDLEPFIVTSVTISTAQYMEIATISGISDKLGRFAIIITGINTLNEKSESLTTYHTVTVLSGFKCNVVLRFTVDTFCLALATSITASPVETFSLIIDKCFPIHLLENIDDPLDLIGDFINRYIQQVKPDFDTILNNISDAPECDLTDPIDIMKKQACIEHECTDICSTECICTSGENKIFVSEILNIGSKLIGSISDIIDIYPTKTRTHEETFEEDKNLFTNSFKLKSNIDGDIL